VQQRLEDFGGEGEPLVFAHANGYPAGGYRQFLGCLARKYDVTGLHHRPMWSTESAPEMLDWNCFAADLEETLEATQTEPVWMMGHSMGAVVSVQAAARRPELFRGLILIDPVFMTPQTIEARRRMPREAIEEMPLVHKTLNRPNRFDSQQEAFEFHRGKRVFAGFSDAVLWDYIRAGTRRTEQGDFELAYCREWEAAAYRSAPQVWDELAAVKLPVLGLRGEDSNTLSEDAFALWAQTQPFADLRSCRGGHLLPLEYPEATADTVLDFLDGLSGG
jgi:pimeloyl-ACP methyl ester carboxylesterase